MPTKEETLKERFREIRRIEGDGESLLEERSWFFPSAADRASAAIYGPVAAEETADRLRILNSAIDKANQKIRAGQELSPREAREYSFALDAVTRYERSDPSDLQEQAEAGELGSTAGAALLEAQQESRQALAGEPIDPDPIDTDNAQIVNGAKQCFLLYNMDNFAKFHQDLLNKKEQLLSNTPHFYGDYSESPEEEIRVGGYYSNVNDSTRIYLAGAGTTNLANKIYLKKHAPKIANMMSAEIAQLIPILRIYKQYLDKKEDEQPTRGELVEFEFPTAFDPKKGITGTTEIDFLGRTENKFLRGMDIGVKSFNWNFVGSDPFTATREVEAELKLFAQSFPAFIAQRKGAVIGGDKSRDYRFVDLVLVPDCRNPDKREKNYRNFSPECYEIRVEVGYNGGDKTFGTFTDDGEFKDAINCHTDILSLVPQSHSFEYGDDGSVSLSIKLRGRLDAIMTDKGMNILLPMGGLADELTVGFGEGRTYTLKQIDDAVASLREKKPADNYKEKIEQLETLKRKIVLSSKQFFTSHIFERLEGAGAIFNYEMTPQENTRFLNWQTKNSNNLPDPISIDAVVAGGRAASGIAETFATNENNQEALNETIQAMIDNTTVSKEQVAYMFLGDLIAVITDSVVGDTAFAIDSRLTRLSSTITGTGVEAELLSRFQSAGDALFELFGYGTNRVQTTGVSTELGVRGVGAENVPVIAPVDVVDSGAIQRAVETGRKRAQDIHENLRIILGNIKVNLKRPGGSEEIDVNLADIPVSVEFFLKFMADNVLSKDILDYPYFHFMNDLIASVVGNMLGSECFGGLTDASVRAQTLVINSNKDISDSDFYSFDEELGYKVVDLSKVSPESNLVNNCGDASSRANLFEYFVVSVSIIDEAKLEGEYDADVKEGVYHLAYGLDRGLVRSIKFNKTNQEFLPEARFASEGGLLLNQLSNAYDVTVEMVGNNLFKIGQLVYIDAEVLGAGPSWADFGENGSRQRSWANIMGLGGYHLVTEVGNSISSDGTFVTTIKARWQTGGSREEWDE
jgi:hypothetical protein